MKNYSFILIVSFFIFSISRADLIPASPQTYLFKLSNTLRGYPPSRAERAELDKVPADQRNQYFQKQIQTYMQDPNFSLILETYINELLQFKIPLKKFDPTQIVFFDTSEGNIDFDESSAADYLIRDMVEQNQSWDTLLTGKSYRLQVSGSPFSRASTEIQQFQALAEQVPQENTPAEYFNETDLHFNMGSSRTVNGISHSIVDAKGQSQIFHFQFPKEDLRLAGLLTTNRFLNRYVNTSLNKNRRRAAAVFRTFLCDSMAPSIPTATSDSQKQDFNTIFPDHSNFTETQLRVTMAPNLQHANSPDCRQCHMKLDPLGQTFAFSEFGISPIAAPGALVYYSSIRDQNIQIPVQGLGELGQVITQQPEYLRCQVEHLWNWFVGQDVPLSRERENSLTVEFDTKYGRKPKDFIASLVQTPEFKAMPEHLTADQILARKVVKLLKNCNNCHSNQTENPTMKSIDLTNLPFQVSVAFRIKLIQKIRAALDVDNQGINASMPPKESAWQLNKDQFLTLKTWLDNGAPDFDGTPQVAPPLEKRGQP